MSHELTTERLLSLRAVPIFQILPINDLQVIARYTTDREFRAGTQLHRANELVDRIQILTHGQVEIFGPGDARRVQDAPFAVGVFPVLAQRMTDYETTAITRVRAVELDGRRLGDLFDDYPRLLLQGITQAARGLLADVQGRLGFAVRGSQLEQVTLPPPEGGLDLVERIFYLRQVLPLERTSIDALASIARQLEPHSFRAGEKVWSTGDRGDAILLVLRGKLESKHGADVVVRDTPGALGGIEALAGANRWYDLRALEDTDTLGLPVDVVIDAFEEHTDMGLDFLAFLAALMLESTKAPGEGPTIALPAPIALSALAASPPAPAARTPPEPPAGGTVES